MSNSQTKQENKFTSGEWTTNYSSFGVVIFNDKCQRIANIPNNNPNSVGDAELIAASPDLLAACESVVGVYMGDRDAGEVLADVVKAVNKARGLQ